MGGIGLWTETNTEVYTMWCWVCMSHRSIGLYIELVDEGLSLFVLAQASYATKLTSSRSKRTNLWTMSTLMITKVARSTWFTSSSGRNETPTPVVLSCSRVHACEEGADNMPSFVCLPHFDVVFTGLWFSCCFTVCSAC